MTEPDPIALFFGDMDKLGPGSTADTLHVLGLLPDGGYETVIDAGCGAGQQTLVLAERLGVPIHAVDTHQPFLDRLQQRAERAGLGHLIQPRCMDMAEIPQAFEEIDLLWSEGAAYNIGFSNALETWRPALRDGGFAVVSELSWLRDEVPEAVRTFFQNGYPAMRSADANRALAEAAGFDVLHTHTLPREAWTEGYYDLLLPQARALLDHPNDAVRSFAAETMDEIHAFDRSEGSYGYVFFVLRKA